MRNAFLLLLTLITLSVAAQDKIEAERPSESISPKTVNKNSLQAEIGFRKTQIDEDDKVWRTPNALLRYGLAKRVELRLETNVEHQRLVSENVLRKGFRSVELGVKAHVIETEGEKFSAAVVGQLGLPGIASPGYKLSKAYNRVRVLFENKISEKIKLAYNIGNDWDSENEEQNWVYSFTPEFEIGNKWETFVEVYGFFKKNKIPEEVFDAGFAYFLSDKTEVDLSGGVGLNQDSPKYFISAGFSFRLGSKHR
ncbi:MAG TPA: transporter [Segetibacter sp.]|jgi:hypothetical protein